MKYLLLIFPVLVLSCVTGPAEESAGLNSSDTTALDTLPQPIFDSIIAYHELANTPFHTEDNLIYFESLINASDSTVLEIQASMHDSSVNDSVTTIYWGKSSMSKINNEFMSSDLMESVVIADDRLKLRNGIGVGDSARTVFSSFDIEFDATKNYNFMQLEAGDATNFLFIEFTNCLVSRIVYCPYTG